MKDHTIMRIASKFVSTNDFLSHESLVSAWNQNNEVLTSGDLVEIAPPRQAESDSFLSIDPQLAMETIVLAVTANFLTEFAKLGARKCFEKIARRRYRAQQIRKLGDIDRESKDVALSVLEWLCNNRELALKLLGLPVDDHIGRPSNIEGADTETLGQPE